MNANEQQEEDMKMFVFIFLCFLLITSCATSMQAVDQTVGSHQPPEYKDGFKDGCDSGYVAAGHPYYRFRKDISRFNGNGLYKQGWNDGFSVCKGKYDSHLSIINRR